MPREKGVLHALACSFDRVLWSNEVKLPRVDLDDVCLIGIAPNDTSQAFEDKHGLLEVDRVSTAVNKRERATTGGIGRAE